MKALVTGADGFIGSHLTEHLLQAGYHVRALAQYNSFNNWGWLEDVAPRPELEIVTGDVRDPNYCREICKDVDIVFHLAALIAIPYSYIAPDSYIDTNVKGTLNICQAARDAKVQRILVTSTSEVYGTAQYVPIDEKHPLQPLNVYPSRCRYSVSNFNISAQPSRKALVIFSVPLISALGLPFITSVFTCPHLLRYVFIIVYYFSIIRPLPGPI